jgi:predicted acylesterase/phospholipase RssA
LPLPKLEPACLTNRAARDDEHFGLMLRATAFVPLINGFRQAVLIDGDSYLDGGLVHRVPLSMIPEERFDEIWIAACSPNGLAELENELERHDRRERLVVVTPSEPLPAGRWTMDWPRISRTIDLGRRDIESAIEKSASDDPFVFVGLGGDSRY